MNSSSAAKLFYVGDRVIVNYMDEEREAVIDRIDPVKGRSGRRFYILDLPGALGRPAYEEWEMRLAD